MRTLISAALCSALCLTGSAFGHVRARRIVTIGGESFVLKLVVLSNQIPSLDPKKSLITPNDLKSIGESNLPLDEVNGRTDQAIWEYLIRTKADHFLAAQQQGIFDWEKNPAAFESMVGSFLRSTFFLILEKAVGLRHSQLKSSDHTARGEIESLNLNLVVRRGKPPASPTEVHGSGTTLNQIIADQFTQMAEGDESAAGEMVGIFAIETLSQEHPTFFLDSRFALGISPPIPTRVDSLIPAPDLWIPSPLIPSRWIKLQGGPLADSVVGDLLVDQWIGDAVFLHSLFVNKKYQRRSILAPIFQLALAHGLLTNSRLIFSGDVDESTGVSIAGPSIVRPTEFFSFTVGEARRKMHAAFGFQVWHDLGNEQYILKATAETLRFDVEWAGKSDLSSMTQKMLYYDTVIRNEAGTDTKIIGELGRRSKVGQIPNIIPCEEAVRRMAPIQRLYLPVN